LGIFLTGIALAEVYEIRRTLLAPIFMHITINAAYFIPILILMAGNLHAPAATWEEAKTAPEWMRTSPSEEIEKQENGMAQWQYAIDTWGTAGSRRWKKEANAFNAVCHWFPDDREACAKAKIGIVAIYCLYLKDYRRAIVEADELLERYPDQKEECAMALAYRGWAYYALRNFEKSEESFKKAIDDFGEYDKAVDYARQGVARLDVVMEK
jgi:tetratricopeptide (TPR) repeat protein